MFFNIATLAACGASSSDASRARLQPLTAGGHARILGFPRVMPTNRETDRTKRLLQRADKAGYRREEYA